MVFSKAANMEEPTYDPAQTFLPAYSVRYAVDPS